MRKLITILSMFALVAVYGQTQDQTNTYSPYSLYGIGQLRFNGTPETRSMGGIGVAYTNIGAINTINPASLSNIRQTVYSLGATMENVSYKDDKQTGNSMDVYFDHIIFAIPLSKKSGIDFGIAPYTVTGYQILSVDSVMVEGSNKAEGNYYNGSGGLNMAFASYGVEVFKNFSVGANVSYIFGNIYRNSYNTMEDRLLQTKITEHNLVNGFKFKFGVNYAIPIKEETSIFLGATYEFSGNIKNTKNYKAYTVSYYDEPYDENNPQNISEEQRSTFKLPWSLGAGIGIGNMKKWYIGADATIGDTPDIKTVDFGSSDAIFVKQKRFALGGYYTPKYNSVKSFLARVRYQGGVYYDQTGLKFGQTSVNDMGMTLGASMPMTKVETQTMSISNLNIFLNLGRLGTTKDKLVKETYFKLGLSFSLNDRWFLKQKFY